jgi:hypothetical protein
MPEHRGRSKEAGKDRVGAASMEDEQHLLAERRRKVQYARAVKHFNRDPKLALQLLEAEGLISGNGPSAARQIAEFLKIGTRMHISKTELGEFLGEKNDLCEQVLKEYALLFDFGKDGVVSALRVFLESFRLPGESQKIERITEAFAQSFFRQQKSGVFLTWDSVHILTFSVIMLNTDLHSPQVKKRMTLDEFVRNNRGINVDKSRNIAEDFPRHVLEDIYRSISQDEIRLDAQQRGGAGGSGGGGCERGVGMGATDVAGAVGGVGFTGVCNGGGVENMSGNVTSVQCLLRQAWKACDSVGRPTLQNLDAAPFAPHMLASLWGPALTALTRVLELGDDDALFGSAMSCIKVMSEIAARVPQTHLLDTLVSALARHLRFFPAMLDAASATLAHDSLVRLAFQLLMEVSNCSCTARVVDVRNDPRVSSECGLCHVLVDVS